MIENKQNDTLTLYIQGGIGNQLFQYAAAYSYAKKYNRQIIINRDSYYGYAWNKDSGFIIDKILPKLNIMPPSFWTVFFEKGKFLEIVGKVFRKLFWREKRTYEEKINFCYNPMFLKNKNWNGLFGFFQSPKYFESCKDDILKIFELPILTEISIRYKRLIENAECPVAIHYRDYGDLSSGNERVKEEFGDLSVVYYEEAMDLINKSELNATFFIFSNSIKSAKVKFAKKADIVFVDYKSQCEWEDMALMSLCNHNIICNSSYSWWSGYLNKNVSKIVVAPKSWGKKLTNKENNVDLFPENWLLI